MKPIRFKECNATIAKDQPEYFPLPAWIDKTNPNRRVVVLWKLTMRERIILLLTGKLWHQMLTFGMPLQPQLLGGPKPDMVSTPEVREKVSE